MILPDTTATPRVAVSGEVPLRRVGPFELLTLLGRSQASMAWRARDRRSDPPRQVFLVMPRVQPADEEALQRWQHAVRRASRLEHPSLAPVLEIGVCERWPYVLYLAGTSTTLAERLRQPALTANDAAACCVPLLQGLAFAHDAGVAHRDLQPYLCLLGDHGSVSLMGLEVAPSALPAASSATTSIDALGLRGQREAARLDLLNAGLMLHWLLAGRPALDETDLSALASSMTPAGRELVRLPWDTSLPVPEVLRTIVNRATDRQPRQRYQSARGMLRAIEGWLQSESAAGEGPLALLLDRLHGAGTLPSVPGGAARAARLATMDRERTNELAEVVLQDLALSFELLRSVNAAQVRATLPLGSGPVLTIRRAIAMLGLEGVQHAALGLRPWPGPLSETSASALSDVIESVQQAGRLAQAMRPAGYDAEVVHLVALLQNLGRLLTAYHFPDEWQQIRRLMQSVPSERAGEPDEAGMSEQSASYAVLGADIESIGAAVARHWGLDDQVLHLIRRLPLTTPPRAVDSDDDMLRAVASCANEAVDALQQPRERRALALRRIVSRYGRLLQLKPEEVTSLTPALVTTVGAASFPT